MPGSSPRTTKHTQEDASDLALTREEEYCAASAALADSHTKESEKKANFRKTVQFG